MDNAVGAKAAYPIYGSQTVPTGAVVLDSVNVGTFICALLYLPHIAISDKNYSLIPFITIAPGMNSTYFAIYNVTDGTMTSSAGADADRNIAIYVYSTTDTIILQANAKKSWGQTVTINGCVVVLA